MVKNLLIDLLGRRKDNFDWRSTMPPLDIETVDSVFVLHHNDKTGDAILISLLVDALAREKPSLAIYVGASPKFVGYWKRHPDVSDVVLLDIRRGFYAMRAVRGWLAGKPLRGRFDVVVSFHPFARHEQFALLRGLAPRAAIGFNKDPFRLFDYSLEEHRHGVDLSMIATRTRSVMRLLGRDVCVERLRAHLPFGTEDREIARATLSSLPRTSLRVLVNTYGAGREKKMTPASARRVVGQVLSVRPDAAILVSAPKGEEEAYSFALDMAGLGRSVVIGPQKGLSPLCALVDAVDLVISPDTSVGHIAAGLGKPQVCLFGRRGSVPEIWRPLNARCAVLVPATGDSVNDVDWSEFDGALREILALADEERKAVSEGSC